MWSRYLLVVGFLLGLLDHSYVAATLTLQNDTKKDKYVEANINEVIGDNIDVLQKALSVMDPIILDEFHIDSLDFHVANGTMSGLSKIEGIPDNKVIYGQKNLTFNFNLKWPSTYLKYDCHWRIIFIYSCDGVYSANLTNLKINVSLTADLKNYEIILNVLDIYDLGNISASIKSEDANCSASDWFTSAITNYLKPMIMNIMDSDANKIIEDYIEKLNKFLKEHTGREFKFVRKLIAKPVKEESSPIDF